jgi:D-alanyl-D-alanine dipeptidase
MANMNDETLRKEYWTRLMDDAYEFMDEIKPYPVSECGEGVLSLIDAVEDAGVEVVFSEKPHVDGLPRVFLYREGLIKPFLAVAKEFNDLGLVLKVEDCFRSSLMQKLIGFTSFVFDNIVKMCLWENNGVLPELDFMFCRMTAVIATCPKIGTHMSASAIDVSVLDRATGVEIDRGGPYLTMSEITPMASPFISDKARANRELITNTFKAHGFVDYPFEYWHFSQGDAYDAYLTNSGTPARYGAVDVDIASGSVEPIADPLRNLNTPEELEHQIAAAVARLS